MDETKEIKVKQKKKISKSALVLIIGLVIIAIPCLVFVGILGISALQTGTPREGSRFDGDLVNEITSSDVDDIEADLNTISSIESIEVILAQGQLKIYIDTDDSLNEKQVDKIVNEAYNIVTSKLPINTYFTKTDSAKMYDLQINVYTTAEDSENRQYKYLHKNSAEESFAIDDMAHPKDAKLKAELEGKITEVEQTDSSEEEEKPTV